jgi:5-methylcytosine-specific restriction endonuclease McrA
MTACGFGVSSNAGRGYSRGSGKTVTWRDSNDYRNEYFKKNPGLLGCIWFCSVCGKPLLGKDKVQVDHIVPPSAFAHKKYKKGNLVSNTSFLSRAMNSSFNTVAACPTCNQRKSDKIGLVTARGVLAKTGEIAIGTAQKGVAYALWGAGRVAWTAGRLVASPFRKTSPFLVKLCFAIVYGLILFYFLNR